MKHIYLLTFAFILIHETQAQVIETGQRIIGGSVGLNYNSNSVDTMPGSNYPNSRHFGVSISPNFGKAIKQNTVLGYRMSVGYGGARTKDSRGVLYYKADRFHVGAGMFLEKFFPLGRSFSFSGVAGPNVNYQQTSDIYYNNSVQANKTSTRSYGIGISATPALNYSINRKVLVQVFLHDFISLGAARHHHETMSGNNPPFNQKSTHFGFSSSVNTAKELSQLSFGFRYIF